MKKLNLLALAFVFGTASLFASNGILDIPLNQIRSQVADLFETPKFNIEKDYSLNIFFTFNAEGKIVVEHVYSLNKNKINKEVLNYVHKTLDDKIIQTPGEMNKVFSMPLKIELH